MMAWLQLGNRCCVSSYSEYHTDLFLTVVDLCFCARYADYSNLTQRFIIWLEQNSLLWADAWFHNRRDKIIFSWLWMISLFLSFSAEWDCGEVEGMDSGTAYEADKQVQRGTGGRQDSQYVTIQLHSSIPTEKRQAGPREALGKRTLTQLFYSLKMNSHVSELTCHTCVQTHVSSICQNSCYIHMSELSCHTYV